MDVSGAPCGTCTADVVRRRCGAARGGRPSGSNKRRGGCRDERRPRRCGVVSTAAPSAARCVRVLPHRACRARRQRVHQLAGRAVCGAGFRGGSVAGQSVARVAGVPSPQRGVRAPDAHHRRGCHVRHVAPARVVGVQRRVERRRRRAACCHVVATVGVDARCAGAARRRVRRHARWHPIERGTHRVAVASVRGCGAGCPWCVPHFCGRLQSCRAGGTRPGVGPAHVPHGAQRRAAAPPQSGTRPQLSVELCHVAAAPIGTRRRVPAACATLGVVVKLCVGAACPVAPCPAHGAGT